MFREREEREIFNKSYQLCEQIVADSLTAALPNPILSNSSVCHSAYSLFLSYSAQRVALALRLLKEGQNVDAGIVSRSILDSFARSWISCVGHLQDSEEIESFIKLNFFNELRRSRKKFQMLSEKVNNKDGAALLEALARFDVLFSDGVSSKRSQETNKFFEFGSLIKKIDAALSPIGVNVHSRAILALYSQLSSYAHAGGIGLIQHLNEQEAIRENGTPQDLATSSGLIAMLASTSYNTALIYSICTNRFPPNLGELWRNVTRLNELLRPVIETNNSDLASELSRWKGTAQ